VEVIFYETSECAIVHFVIPDLAREEVRTASLTIKKVVPCPSLLCVSLTTPQAIQQICNQDFRNIAASIPILLDAPRYLYVSTNVSLKFPNLLESAIIQSYHTYYPSDAPWSQSITSTVPSRNGWWMSNTRNRVGKSLITSTLQYLGATSPTLQRVVIHLVQPLLVSSIVYLWITLYKTPIWFTLVGVLVLLLVIRSCYLQRKNSNAHLASENEVHPVDAASSEPLKRSNTDEQHSTPKSTKTDNSSRLIAQIGVASLCEEKSDPDSASEPEKMSIDDHSSLEPPEDSHDSSLGLPEDSRASLESSIYSSDGKGKFHSPPAATTLRRKYSDNSLSGSVLSSIDSPMEFSDPDDDSLSEDADADSFA
jgi:hypothetical protein